MRISLPAGGELNIAALHPIELVFVRRLISFLDHRVSMGEFARDYIAKDLRIAVRMCGEASAGSASVFIEDSNGTEGLESGIVVACEREAVLGQEPAVIGIPSFGGASWNDLCM